jgi:hypothetical protein
MKSEPGLAAEDLPPALSLPMRLALWMVAGLVLAGWLALVVLHVNDDYRVTHLQGVWTAMVEAARAGQLYPPLFDGEHYAGTRWMPLPILVNALAASLIGDSLIGGKVLAAVAASGALDAFERGAWGTKFPTVVASWRRAWTHVIPFQTPVAGAA